MNQQQQRKELESTLEAMSPVVRALLSAFGATEEEVNEAIKMAKKDTIDSVMEELGEERPVVKQSIPVYDDFETAFLAGHKAATENFIHMLSGLEEELVDKIANKIAFNFGCPVDFELELTPIFEDGYIEVDAILKI